ncbi:MAG TPA: alpha/beta hydrolase [Planctomycetaceae bacterium]|nr:alpha/beta hydrolase [Planctomycetaceae bacterium]
MNRLSTLLLIAICSSPQCLLAQAVVKPIELSIWNNGAPVGDGGSEKVDVRITVHQPANPNGTAIVICPGGGYATRVSGPEGHGIAQWLNKQNITGVVLDYRLPEGRATVPLLDAQRAIRTVRANAARWKLDPRRIGIMGFSAGGHLASTAGTHFDGGEPKHKDLVERESCRPDFMILVYPVISFGELGHAGSRRKLLGENATDALITKFSNETQITRDTPPTFLAHALDDKAVSSDNSKMFFDALKRVKVPARYLELASGGHGLNRYQGPMWDAWQLASLDWLAEQKLHRRPNSSAGN